MHNCYPIITERLFNSVFLFCHIDPTQNQKLVLSEYDHNSVKNVFKLLYKLSLTLQSIFKLPNSQTYSLSHLPNSYSAFVPVSMARSYFPYQTLFTSFILPKTISVSSFSVQKDTTVIVQ